MKAEYLFLLVFVEAEDGWFETFHSSGEIKEFYRRVQKENEHRMRWIVWYSIYSVSPRVTHSVYITGRKDKCG